MLVGVAIGTRPMRCARGQSHQPALRSGCVAAGRECFVERQVGDDQSFDARLRRVGEEALGSVGEHGVQIGEQDEWYVRTVRGRQLQHVVGRYPREQRLVGGLLHDGPVGDRVRERDAELYDVGAGVDQRLD